LKVKILKTDVSLKDYPLEVIRYSAYTLTGDFYVQLFSSSKDKIEIHFEPKGKKADLKKALSLFKQELKDELLRSKIFEANYNLREYLLRKSMAYQERMGGPEDIDMKGLTPEQEKELEELIAQVEDEIKKELKKSGENEVDPLEIKKTWEEKYGNKIKEKFIEKNDKKQ